MTALSLGREYRCLERRSLYLNGGCLRANTDNFFNKLIALMSWDEVYIYIYIYITLKCNLPVYFCHGLEKKSCNMFAVVPPTCLLWSWLSAFGDITRHTLFIVWPSVAYACMKNYLPSFLQHNWYAQKVSWETQYFYSTRSSYFALCCLS